MIAIIAGTGLLPLDAAKALLEQGKNFIIVCLFPSDNKDILEKELLEKNIKIISQEFYKAGTILSILKDHGVTKVLFIGKVDKSNLFKNLKLDWLCVKTLAKATTKTDKTIMESIIDTVQDYGITVLKQSDILQNLFVKPSILCGTLTQDIKENIDFGLNIADQLSLIDIGQTVVVKNKMIIAVEAIEGTDNCIKKAIEFGHDNLIICKTAHKDQNKKYDLPTLGPKTLENIKLGQVLAIAWHSDKTFISNLDQFVRLAKELDITLVSI